MRGRAKLELTVQAARRALRPHADYRCLHRWARSALLRDAVLTLRFVSRQEARRLNRSFRGGDYAGNVLTFNYGTHSCDDCGEPIRADIVICMPVVDRSGIRPGSPEFLEKSGVLLVRLPGSRSTRELDGECEYDGECQEGAFVASAK